MKKNISLQISVQNLLAYIQPDMAGDLTSLAQMLSPFQERGLATAEQVAAITGLDYKRVAEKLAGLSIPGGGRPAAFHRAEVRLEAQRGRPKKLYILTDEGAQVVRAIFNCQTLCVPKAVDAVELTAAFAAMEVFARAVSEGLDAHVEEPLFIADSKSNVRVDVLIDVGQKRCLFEVEQRSNQGTLPRVVDKLARLQNLFVADVSKILCPQVRVLFNLPPEDTQTIWVWEEAMREVMDEINGPLAFELFAIRITDFLDSPSWDRLDSFQLIHPAKVNADVKSPRADHNMSGQPAVDTENIHARVDVMRVVMAARDRVYGEQLRNLQNHENHEKRVQSFFEIMRLIYYASHYMDSPVQKYAAVPTESLSLLKQYLHDAQNASLLSDLTAMLKWTAAHNTGIMALRNCLTTIIWDCFLLFHGFAQGGPLRVAVNFPDFNDNRSDIYTEVHILDDMAGATGSQNYHSQSPDEKALAWVLDTLISHPHALGIGEKPWLVQRGSRKRK